MPKIRVELQKIVIFNCFSGLSGAVGRVFGCCPKGYGLDTQLRRLVFAKKIVSKNLKKRIVKIETNFLCKNQSTKLGIEPATFRATAKHATYCTTEPK